MAHPTLTSNHARNTSNIHVRKACPEFTSDHERNQSSHLCQKGPTLTSNHERNHSIIHVKNALQLQSTMRGTNPTYMLKSICTYIRPCKEPIQHTCSKGICTYIFPCEEPIQHACQKGSALTSDHGGNTSCNHVRMALSTRLSIPGNYRGASIQRMAFNTYVWSCRNQSYSHIRMDQHSYLTWKEPILSPWQNVSALTFDLLVKMALGLIISPWREPRYGEHQASPWSTQNSLWPFLA